MMRALPLVALVCGLAVLATPAQKRKKKEEETQTLQIPKELPSAVTGDTRRLTFYVTPPSAKGLLSQQIRDALKALAHEAGNDTVLKIRAFVAGSGDLRAANGDAGEYASARRVVAKVAYQRTVGFGAANSRSIKPASAEMKTSGRLRPSRIMFALATLPRPSALSV